MMYGGTVAPSQFPTLFQAFQRSSEYQLLNGQTKSCTVRRELNCQWDKWTGPSSFSHSHLVAEKLLDPLELSDWQLAF